MQARITRIACGDEEEKEGVREEQNKYQEELHMN